MSNLLTYVPNIAEEPYEGKCGLCLQETVVRNFYRTFDKDPKTQNVPHTSFCKPCERFLRQMGFGSFSIKEPVLTKVRDKVRGII